MKIKIGDVPKKATELADSIKKFVSASPKRETAVVVALSGDLGSGKTFFTSTFAKILGVKEAVLSPTFVMMKSFPVLNPEFKKLGFKKLVHFDVYRIEKKEEMAVFDWVGLVSDPSNIIFIEWAEKISGMLLFAHFLVSFSHTDEKTRDVDIFLKK